jgi:methylthioribose-1-phosphate isomerase
MDFFCIEFIYFEQQKYKRFKVSYIFSYFYRKSKIMKINGKHYHTIWVKENDPKTIEIIDQRFLPFQFKIVELKTLEDTFIAIKEMLVRGAPLIGVTAAYGMYLGILSIKKSNNIDNEISNMGKHLESSRPTAVNLKYAIDLIIAKTKNAKTLDEKIKVAFETANQLKQDEIENCRLIGEFGFPLIEKISTSKKGETVNILTHCNAGWLACVDYGTATAPIYLAHNKGIKLHVWVDETRPRNQGARLTAFELGEEGIPHTVIADNTGGLLMQKGMVDMVIVGSDRTSANGDVANKIGTYLKALAAHDNKIPFYAALPISTIDFEIKDGVKEIPIEERNQDEVRYIEGWHEGEIKRVRLTPENSNALNYGFDVTPSKYVTAIITEKGICKANQSDIEKLK